MSKNDGKQCHYTKKMDGAIDVVGEAFAAVRFPSMPCHLWRVVKVEGDGTFKSPPRGFKWLNMASPFKFLS